MHSLNGRDKHALIVGVHQPAQAPDVDPELQRVGAGDGEKVAVEEPPLDLPPLLRQVTPAVGEHERRAARVTVDGQAIKLTSHEYRVLHYLMMHRDRVVSRTELVEHLYEQDFDRDSNTVEVFIGRLRKKLPVDLIKTVRGLGYRLTDNPDGA